ncbi:phosphatase PAP2 family protein [uncultured Tateyamaria sp.]|uniref:phosphatase PAP2 family protein n=1 Tax=uncultured Tateyamaria sp. TaxID=455651 RepID=UPI0026017129|nr:phosphatase PAP2 family protein [uncultured Tateyamaria sp.]
MTNRDGIVGATIDKITHPNPAPPNDPNALKRLSTDVQTALYMSELAPTVDVTAQCEGGTPGVTVWRRDGISAGGKAPKFSEMMEMTAPTIDQLADQMNYLEGYSQIRGDRAAEILGQISLPIPFFATIGYMDPSRTPRTLELLNAATMFSFTVIQRTKFALAVKRPIEFSPQVQPMIPTPTHASLPSGHATEAFLIARILWKLLRESQAPQYTDDAYWGEMLMRQASRVAINRTVAGVHFPVDSAAGALLGLTLAEHIHDVADGCGWTSSVFDGTSFNSESDFEWHALYRPDGDRIRKKIESGGTHWGSSKKHDHDGTSAAMLNWLWKQAVAEWRDLPASQD